MAAKQMKSIFGRDLCLDENTAQAASVDVVPHQGTTYARSRLQKPVGKPRRVFRQAIKALCFRRGPSLTEADYTCIPDRAEAMLWIFSSQAS